MGKFVISIIQGNVGLGRSEVLVCGYNTYAAIVTGADRALSFPQHTPQPRRSGLVSLERWGIYLWLSRDLMFQPIV